MSELISCRPTPGSVYVSVNGQRILIESVYGEEEDEFYLVNIVPEEDDIDSLGEELVPFPFSFEWLVHHKPGEVYSGLCLHQTT
ncbi:hypothetical protein, partial [Vibrio navarrensis]|uniref:hypothetical protein n=1 Tax=Vibrio navarrensis TaxID=29495 RepID=UPI00057EE1DA